MNRTQRRAAQHLARKVEQKAMNINPVASANPVINSIVTSETAPLAKPVSEAQLAANRLNAKLSTGPKTEAGKTKCSHNAVKTALTGQTVLLGDDDVAEYEKLGQRFIKRLQPATPEEECLVQLLIDAEWRLMRIPALEMGIYAIGREALVESVPAHLLEAEVHLKYERHLKNLHLQENRIRRHRESDLKALRELQAARLEAEAKQKQSTTKPPQPAPEVELPTLEIPAEASFRSAA
jgi:hypothetical protein